MADAGDGGDRHDGAVPLVQSILEGMSMNKMNILHFHLSEECFRIESKIYKGLTSGCVVNGHNDTAFYTQDEISDLVEFAKARGIRVIPEFDMPGHSGGFCNRLQTAGIKCCGSQIEDDPAGASAKVPTSKHAHHLYAPAPQH